MNKLDLITAAQLRAAFTAFKDYVDGGQHVPVPPGPPRPEPEPEEPEEPEPEEPTTPKVEVTYRSMWFTRDMREDGWDDTFIFWTIFVEDTIIPDSHFVSKNYLTLTVNEPITVTVTTADGTHGKLWVGRLDGWYMYDTNETESFVLSLEPGDYSFLTSEGAVNIWAKISDFGYVPY